MSESRKISYNIKDVIVLKKAIDETTFQLLRTSTIEDVAYFGNLFQFSLDLGELITSNLKCSTDPVLYSPEYDFDTSNL